jgi:hypothetical protein
MEKIKKYLPKTIKIQDIIESEIYNLFSLTITILSIIITFFVNNYK